VRILYHHRTLSDGAEGLQLASVVNAFRAPGHDVKVVSLVGNKNIAARRRARIVEQVRRYMPRWVYELMEMGYNLPGYHMLTSRVNGWIPEFLYERYSLFNLSGLMTARRPGIPLVLEVNSPLAYERTQYEHLSWKRGAKISEGFLLSRADIVLTVSTPLKDYLVDQGILADKIVVIPNGVDPEIFRPDPQRRVNVRSRFGIPEDGIVVGFAHVAGLVGEEDFEKIPLRVIPDLYGLRHNTSPRFGLSVRYAVSRNTSSRNLTTTHRDVSPTRVPG